MTRQDFEWSKLYRFALDIILTTYDAATIRTIEQRMGFLDREAAMDFFLAMLDLLAHDVETWERYEKKKREEGNNEPVSD